MDIKHRDNRQKWGLCDNVRLWTSKQM
jgi:hypothetical protein